MPKIIDQVREKAIGAARQILLEEGYRALTMRRVAAEAGVAAGTLYHYFSSKEYLAACIMLEDWQEAFDRSQGAEQEMPLECVRWHYDLILRFSDRYRQAWTEYEATGQAASMLHRYHGMLVKEISDQIAFAFSEEQLTAEPWLPFFLSELILSFASDGRSFETIEPAVQKLLLSQQGGII